MVLISLSKLVRGELWKTNSSLDFCFLIFSPERLKSPGSIESGLKRSLEMSPDIGLLKPPLIFSPWLLSPKDFPLFQYKDKACLKCRLIFWVLHNKKSPINIAPYKLPYVLLPCLENVHYSPNMEGFLAFFRAV